MTDELTGRLAAESWEMRKKMDELVKIQMSEDEALSVVTHHDPDRLAMLQAWKDTGLWPVSESERLMRSADLEGLSGVADMGDLLSGDEEWSVPGNAQDPVEEIPSGWMEQILAAVRVTLNAAIMDYHNQYGTRTEERLSGLEEHAARLEGSGEPEIRSDEIRGMVEQAVRESLSKVVPGAQPVSAFELEPPPRPQVQFGSRGVEVERARLTAICDKALLDLFHRDRKRRGYDENEMMDFVLYNFYDRPALSFQMNEGSGDEPPRSKV